MARLKLGDVVQLPAGFKVYNGGDSTTVRLKHGGLFIVVATAMTGGGCGYGPHDVYPDGWHVTISKLKGCRYNPKAKRYSFYQSGCFTVMHKDVPVVACMEPTFVPNAANSKKLIAIAAKAEG